MDTSRIPTVDEALTTAKAVAQLEQANRRLLECSSSDAAEMEAALMERDEAVRAIGEADPSDLGEPLGERLLQAFEDGRRIREKLAAFYRKSDGQLRQVERILADGQEAPSPPNVSAIG